MQVGQKKRKPEKISRDLDSDGTIKNEKLDLRLNEHSAVDTEKRLKMIDRKYETFAK